MALAMSSEALYHQELVRLARAAVGAGHLHEPGASASRDNPLCGDQVTVEVRLRDGVIAELAHRVRGCVLCQASASLLGQSGPGATIDELRAAHQALAALLHGGAAVPGGRWAGLQVFAPVHSVPSRHGCVLMPFEAIEAALAAWRK